jgi:hypothetical protein
MGTQKQISIPHNPNPKKDESGYYSQKRGRPFLFQINSPNGQPLFQNLLALHTNPTSLTESMTKNKNVVMTYGGFVEFIWPDELDSISASHSAGAFLGPSGLVNGSDGLTSPSSKSSDSKKTIAWERFQDLLDLFQNNGTVYDGAGKPVLRGQVLMIYDRGIFQGYFSTFTVTESDELPFTVNIDWEFKVEKIIYKFPINIIPDVVKQGNGKSALRNASSFGISVDEARGVDTSTNQAVQELEAEFDKIPPLTTPVERDIKQATSGGGGNAQKKGGRVVSAQTEATTKATSPNIGRSATTGGGSGSPPGGSSAPAPESNQSSGPTLIVDKDGNAIGTAG